MDGAKLENQSRYDRTAKHSLRLTFGQVSSCLVMKIRPELKLGGGNIVCEYLVTEKRKHAIPAAPDITKIF